MPVFDELERLAVDRGDSWLIDKLLNEYSRLGRDKLDLPRPALEVLIALLTESVFPVPGTRRTILDPAAGAGSLLFPVLTSTSTGSSVDIYGSDRTPTSAISPICVFDSAATMPASSTGTC